MATSGSTSGSVTPVGLAKLGLKGGRRLRQTALAVYPRAWKWLLGWRQPTPEELRELFEELGATYIKLGQLIASSPSVFPKEYVEAFQSCLDQTPPIPFREVRDIIEQDLGGPIDEIFQSIDPVPLASASIAQVHGATLSNGADVVIKVQKPGVRDVLTTDMNALYLITRLLEIMLPNMDKASITGMVEELFQAMLDECDFEKEANHLQSFRDYLHRSGNSAVRAPRPYPGASGKQVLTMERFYGVALTDEEALAALGDEAAGALFAALNTWFASLTQCDFFHADLHSGNLLLLDDGAIGFIDFGMVGRIPESAWQGVFGLFQGISSEDFELMANSMLQVGMTRDSVDVGALAADIRQLYNSMFNLSEAVAEGRNDVDPVGQFMTELGGLARRYGIRFPRAFTLVLKQFLYFDRYLSILAPGADLFGDDRVDFAI